jgi:magnesium transporter
VIRAVVYTADGVEHYDDVDLASARDAAGTTWVRVSEASPEELSRVADVFGLHALSVEDLTGGVRPKTEEFADHTFVLVKTAALRRGETTFSEEIRSNPVGLFVGDDWLVSMSPDTVGAVGRVWDAVEAENARVLRSGPDFAAYRVVDSVVDEYFALLDESEDRIEEIEESVLAGPDPDLLGLLNTVRRDLLSVRKLLWPTREAVGVLARGDPDQIDEATEKYFRDVYDHLVQLVDLTETYRDLASGARDIYLNTLSQSTNEVMKKLTVVATIILPLTFIVGVFGMNFGDSPYNMPELGWRFAYPAVMVGMATVSAVLLGYFRREGWL